MIDNTEYRRFENTAINLDECLSHLSNGGLSESEKRYRRILIEICQEIVEKTEDEEGD